MYLNLGVISISHFSDLETSWGGEVDLSLRNNKKKTGN
jgi:hypothetical protein